MTNKPESTEAKGCGMALPRLDFQLWKSLVNNTAPSGVVNMYEVFNAESKETLFTVGVDFGKDIKQETILRIVRAVNQSALFERAMELCERMVKFPDAHDVYIEEAAAILREKEGR